MTEVKGRPEMVEVLRRLAEARIRVPADEQVVPIGLRTVRYSPDVIETAITTARANDLPLNDAKGVFTEVLLRDARQQLIDRDVAQEDLARLLPDLRKSDGFKKMIDRVWPSLSGAQLVRSLLGSPTNRKKAVDGLLGAADAELLQRSSAKKISDEPWTAADLPLLDEANALTTGGGRTYGHVVVDEAQDLSAMALRAAGRRATGGSMTILGDIAQATGVGAQASWDAVTTGLGIDHSMVAAPGADRRLPGAGSDPRLRQPTAAPSRLPTSPRPRRSAVGAWAPNTTRSRRPSSPRPWPHWRPNSVATGRRSV